MPRAWRFRGCLWSVLHVLCCCVLAALFFRPVCRGLLACCGQCFVPGLNVVSFHQVCSGLLVKWPDTNSTRNKVPQNSLVERYGMDRGLCWSSGEGAHHTGTETSLTEKSSPTRAQGLGHGVSKLDIQHGPCSTSLTWLCVYVWGGGRDMAPASSFVPGEASLWMLPLREMLLE